MDDTSPPRSAAEALSIIERQQARTGHALSPDVALMNTVWGLAYLLGGAAYYLYRVGVLGGLLTVVACLVIGAAAIATSIVYSVRGSQGVRSAPELERRGAYYGFGWVIALVLTGVLTYGAGTAVLTPVLFVFVVGLLYLAGGAVWTDPLQYAGGVWIMLVAVAAIFVPSPAHILVLAVGAGGGMLVLGRMSATRAAHA